MVDAGVFGVLCGDGRIATVYCMHGCRAPEHAERRKEARGSRRVAVTDCGCYIGDSNTTHPFKDGWGDAN